MIYLFKLNDIEVVGIRSGISSYEAYIYFNENLKLGLNCKYLLTEKVMDQICERDFYFGVAGSGISIKNDDSIYKAPYFIPYGNPFERASIPKEYENIFSIGCINRSISLWEEIEKLSNKKILIKDLPEKIFNTNENDEVIKTLKKGKIYNEKITNRNNG